MESLRNSAESDPREELDAFLKSLDGVALKNSDGKDIVLELNKREKPELPEEFRDNSEPWTVEFEGYPGGEIFQTGNYLRMIVDPDEKYVEISYIRLTDKDLRGKNIYPQIMNLIGSHFPKDFSLRAVIENEKTRDEALKLFEDFEEGIITEDDLHKKIRKSGMLRLTTNAGFNEISVTLEDGDVVVVSKKNPESSSINLNTDIKSSMDVEDVDLGEE